jgi:predicted acyl esterase
MKCEAKKCYIVFEQSLRKNGWHSEITLGRSTEMRIKLVFFAICLALFTTAGYGQPSEAQRELAKYIRENYSKQEVMIPMRDGVKLFTSIYTPEKRSQKYPILLKQQLIKTIIHIVAGIFSINQNNSPL